ncbi:hypothetical protein BpHYR1_027694 [Brachionus plicatilis]|uniref:Uncharacterized protein n=1 Tax=Brachionus plicatilis TaxID=10195 RepID=A0A3M7P4N1_BRAPC|nr:hypothetical protein BpHYR1_027694 [Brachionus plicatilis]
MIPVPSPLSAGECNPNELDRSSKIYQIIKEKLVNDCGYLADRSNTESNRTINNSLLNSTLNAQDSSYIFENVVKLDIYKTLYDYLNFTIVDKHYLFYIDVNNLHNMKEIGTCFEKKSRDNNKYFKIGDLCCNEQFNNDNNKSP